jgi:hypothetical protein
VARVTELTSTRRRKPFLSAAGSGEGRGEVGDSRAVAGTHLTLPLRGPLNPAVRALSRYAPLLVLALAWEAVSRLGIVSPAALPPLDKVAFAWLNLAASGDLWTNGVSSISRAAAGLG